MREIDRGWIDRVCDDVLSRFPDIISRLGVEADSGLGIEGVPCGFEGWSGVE